MAIQGISNTGLIDALNQISESQKATSVTNDQSFSDILNMALTETVETDAVDKIGNMEMLSGDLNMLHTTTIDAEKAELSLRLTLQVRNKVLDAYSEIMRMQV